ncbi:Dihydroorotase or related cyclic amidohydrolase (AllB) (PDB:1J79) [Commensalibacter communis]|uniref:dihydroorotase n=1 Tax=Commensalibacter communis TaxID=2972786 RepID=UPI0022FF938F|nr:dihydroorotase [Commensalibacter communis]CAI3932115.1 Dihydroorotase or related cyclic amidohydrolase (AllB) (PDB:1J79) [Commensalibacter communis]
MHYDLILKNGICIFPWGEEKANIGIKNGRILSLTVGTHDDADQVIDAQGLHVLPGLMDCHVHFREPGNALVETIETGTKAAALGGLTTVFDMPNTNPATADLETVQWKQKRASETSWINFGFYIGATRENTKDLASLETQKGVCGIKVYAGSSTGSLMVEDDASLEQVMLHGHRRVCYHAEDEYRLQERKKLFCEGMPYENHSKWRDEECAFLGTRRIIALARKTGRPAHILHTTTQEELEWLVDHKDIATVEVLVNHLTQIGPECYERLGGFAVMNPPIRDQRHYDACWEAIRNGVVDVVSSDHAPHDPTLKAKPWLCCPSGMLGVQTIVPLMLNHVNEGRLSLSRLADVMAANPARIYGMPTKGRIQVGYDADFTLVDMGKKNRITNDWIASPAGWTPYDQVEVKGWPMVTIVKGRVVMQNDEMLETPKGQLVNFLP